MHKEKQEILDNNKKEIDKGEERGLSRRGGGGEVDEEKGLMSMEGRGRRSGWGEGVDEYGGEGEERAGQDKEVRREEK